MALKEHKYSENIAGSFYVDDECIACDACTVAAPKHFVMTEDKDHAYVCKQPQNEAERDECIEAMEGCPVDAIGQDGL